MMALLVHCSCISAKAKTPVAVKGMIDLKQYAGKGNFDLALNGEWEFYWKKILRPSDFAKAGEMKPDYYGEVPSYWTDYPKDKVKTERFGYATYRLTIILPPGFRKPIGLDLPVFDSAFDLYINDEYLAGNGVPGTTESETKPEYFRQQIEFNPSSDTISIIANVSNFDNRRGGFPMPMKLGTLAYVQKHAENSRAVDWATISLLFGFSFFFLFFFFLYPKDKKSVFFSMAVIGLALRFFFTTHFLILNFTNLSWVWIIRFEYLSLFLILFGSTWFTVNLYPSKIIRIIAWIITFIFSIAFIVTPFIPVKIFSYSIIPYYPSMLVILLYLLFESLKGILRKNMIDIVFFSTFLLLAFSVIHDTRVSLGKSDSLIEYSFPFIVMAFILIHAITLLYKWFKGYYEKEELQDELELMNWNLELIVDERTKELKTRNEEIELKNTMIASQNKQLADTLVLKNKIYSVIAHDLRNPAVNILYMLNLLKEKEYKDNYDANANSCIQYCQSIINLLENMLVWGKGHEDKIRFSPDEYDLAGIILTNLSIFKENADRKEITLNFTHKGRAAGYFDKDLVDIIIRNILTNAVKYTNRGGRISILAKELSHNDDGILIKICDNGVGISKDRQQQLFDNEEITSTRGTEGEKGTGLGLKLCYELVKINKGKISVDSNEGEGTCFSIVLPTGKPL
jgi:signal transduction histidine kinase